MKDKAKIILNYNINKSDCKYCKNDQGMMIRLNFRTIIKGIVVIFN